MNDQLIIDIQNRIRDVESLDDIFEAIDMELYIETEENFDRL